ncbi:hypothetical protein EG68_02860 [Paragonimus skrjabini miyazakii]|uniref:EF-hand domain-containing protein n=1 Tax=Paragonimus skrjabini miyazakii TaxID=59628 RepID=A0A8S9Z9Z6_9TREM|nr:hypothetical protein EG68_02860 [Paragonimus skrjabini miyazakii]
MKTSANCLTVNLPKLVTEDTEVVGKLPNEQRNSYTADYRRKSTKNVPSIGSRAHSMYRPVGPRPQIMNDYLLVPTSIGMPKPIFLTTPQKTEVFSPRRSLNRLRLSKRGCRSYRASRSTSSTRSRKSSVLSSVTRFDLDEIEYLLQIKAKQCFRELRRNFIINDPEGVGNLSREAFLRVLTCILHWPIKQKHVTTLLKRLGFPNGKKASKICNNIVISFTEFHTALTSERIGCRPLVSNRSLVRSRTLNPGQLSIPETRTEIAPIKMTLVAKPTTGNMIMSGNTAASVAHSDVKPDDSKWMEAETGQTNWSFITQLAETNTTGPKHLSAPQAMALLRHKIHKSTLHTKDLVDGEIPCEIPIMPRQTFAYQLAKLGILLSNSEFLKLWRRFEPNDRAVIPTESILRHLCTDRNGPSSHPTQIKRMHRPAPAELEYWLLQRFRRGCRRMRKLIESHRIRTECEDKHATLLSCGWISAGLFAEALKILELPTLELKQVPAFFKRYGLQANVQGLWPHRELLRRFQNRSEAGVAHQLLTDTILEKKSMVPNENKYNQTDENLIKLEHQMIVRFHQDFLKLLTTLRNSDPERQGHITQEAFRSALKKNYSVCYTKEEFAELINNLPLDHEGNIRYGEFMRQFDSTSSSLNTLFDDDQALQALTAGPPRKSPVLHGLLDESKNSICARCKQSEATQGAQADDDQNNKLSTPAKYRTYDQLYQLVREQLQEKTNLVQKTFQDIDELNSGRMTQDQLFQLIQSLGLQPQLTRCEVRELWPHLFVDSKETLSFQEFLRHFLYKKSEASYPNAKVAPPRIGDSDLMPSSNRLNGVTCLLKDSLRSKMELLFEQLLREFTTVDTDRTGYASRNQLVDIVTELCLPLNEDELNDICKKFDLRGDGTISYVALLDPFARKRGRAIWNKRRDRSCENTYDYKIPQFLCELQTKKHVSQLGWNQIRRTMQHADTTKNGRLDASVFRDLFHEGTGVRLTDEQVYQLLTAVDPSLSGTLPYVRLLEEAQNHANHPTHVSK